MMDSGTILVAGIMAAGNFGGILLLAKKYAGAVDEHNRVIPAVLETLKTINTSAEKTAQSLKELYDGRNDHENRLVEVETVHKIKGCDQPAKG